MLRLIKPLIPALLICLLFTSCEKEYSEENGLLPNSTVNTGGGTSSGTAVFDLQGAPNTCTNSMVGGVYTVGIPLTSSNVVSIYADVTSIGTYTISTATINGVTFSASGSFTSTGSQQILLVGSGTPTATGNFNFKPGTNFCSFPITFTNAPSAAGTLGCAGITSSGVYTQSVALDATNTLIIPVNVTTAGAYSITTAPTNGVTFSGSGSLSAGSQSISLTGSGTPTNDGAVSFTVALGSSSCNYSITFNPAPPPAVGTLDCANITVNGTYTQGTALNSSNTLTVPVNVTTPGLYSITASANGVTFSASGVIGNGAQTITLNGTGTPTNSGDFTFTISLGSSTCNESITFDMGPTDFLRCSIDGGPITDFNTGLSGTYLTGIFDVSGSSGSLDLSIGVTDVSGANIPAGTYTNLTATNNQIYCDDQLSSGSQIFVDASVSTVFTVVITSVSPTVVTGTFSGTLTDFSSSTTRTLSNGSFSVTY